MMSNNRRYEFKFVIKDVSFQQLTQVLLMHPYSVGEVYHPRWINNIYYDSEDLISYHEYANGISRRTKYRVRWYGEDSTQVKDPILEVKNKENMLGWKDYIQLEAYDVKKDINDILLENNIVLPNLIPVTQNQYLRSYYLSMDKKFRITIDQFIGHKLPLSNQTFLKEEKIVLELKFDKKDESLAKQFIDFLPFRQNKNSKFGSGIELLF